MFEENDDSLEFSEANPLAELVMIDEVFNHPNADLLDLVSPDGSNVNFAVVKKGQFKKGDLGVWIDSVNDPMVPAESPDFSFLKNPSKKDSHIRIKTMRLRGIVSRGILLPLAPQLIGKSNREISEALGIKKWIPNNKIKFSFHSGKATGGPTKLLGSAKYDIESLNKGWRGIPLGTEVYITEKIHGTNASYGWLKYEDEFQFFSRSRTLFKLEPNDDEPAPLWWEIAYKYGLKEKLSRKPGLFLYGEIYGKVQDLRYGVNEGYEFVAFDCWNSLENRYLNWNELADLTKELDIPMVPVLARLAWNTESGIPKEIIELAEGKTKLSGDNIREGIVLRAEIPDYIIDTLNDIKITRRIIYKLVGNGYLTR